MKRHMEKEEIQKAIIGAILLGLAILTFFIARPYLITVLTSAVLGFLFYPVYTRVKKIIKNKHLAAGLVTILAILIVVIPMIFIIKNLISEAIVLYNSGIIDKTISYFTELLNTNIEIKNILIEASKRGINYLASNASKIIVGIPSSLLNIAVGIYVLYYIMINGEEIKRFIQKNLHIKNKEKIIKHMSDASFSIVYGTLLTAILQMAVAAIGFKIIGVQAAILWAFLIGILAFIPFAGSAIVWIPIAIVNIITKAYPQAIGIIIIGLIISAIETFLRPKIIGSRADIHPVLVLIGALGGVEILGIIGLVVGPIVLSSFFTILKDYNER